MSDDVDPKLRGLGRGLNALFEDEEGIYPQADMDGDTPAGRRRDMLGVEQMQPSLLQPRSHFDEEALAQLAESIKAHGLLQPILVRQDPHSEELYEIIAGERRWRAAQKAQLHEVPVVILNLDDKQALEIALIENLQREDLNPVEEAHGYHKLIEEYGHTQEKVAETLGKSRSYVANMVRLLKLPKSVLALLEKGELSIGHARALIGLENAEALAKEAASKSLSVRQMEALAAESEGRAPAPSAASAKPAKDVDTLALEEEISNRLGMKVSIDSRDGKKGVVKVSFSSLDQLDDILERLTSAQPAPTTPRKKDPENEREVIHSRLMS